MNTPVYSPLAVQFTGQPSVAARERMLSRQWEPMFVAGWRRVLMMHFEVDARALQRSVPFTLDLHEGRAFVSLVAFSLVGMRPRYGGRLAAWAFRSMASHEFLNVRTYVNCNGEPGIHFLAEWLNNRLAVTLGPVTFGLPYHYGKIVYEFDEQDGRLCGRVSDIRGGRELSFAGNLPGAGGWRPAEAGSLTEWLMERYTAYNSAGGRRRFFRVWHPPWPQRPAEIQINDLRLLTGKWPWLGEAQFVGANYSPGFDEVWMGRPHRVW